MAKVNVSNLYMPRNTDPETRKAFMAIIEKVKALAENTVTESDLNDEDFISESTAIVQTTTGGDTNPPVDPTDLTATKYENRIRLSWTNSTSTDAAAVYVYRSEDGGAITFVGVATYPARYYDDLDVSPFSDYVYYIAAVDDAGNVSGQVMTTVSAATLPAPDAVLYETWSGDDLNLSWDPVDGFGVTGYRVEFVGLRTVNVTEPNYSYTFARNVEDGLSTSVTVRVYTIGSDGSISPSYVSATITHSTPAPTTDLSVTRDSNDLGFILTWTLSSDPGVIGYDITAGGSVIEHNYAGNQYLYKTIPTSGSHTFAVQTVNKFGQTSAANSYTIVISDPGMPTNINIKVLDNWANVFWIAPAVSAGQLPIAEYVVYKQELSGTYVEELATTNSTVYPDLEYVPGEYRYFVMAVDIAGNTSDLASATCEIESPNFQLLTDVWEDFDDATATNFFERDDGVLIAPVNTTETWAEHFTSNGMTSMQDFIDAGYVYAVEPTPTSAAYSFELDYGTVINQATNIISTTDVDNALGATLDYYLASKELSGDSYSNEVNDNKLNASGFQYARSRIAITSDGTQFCYINSRRLQLSSKKRSESHLFEVTVAGTPDTVTFNTPFISITHVSASLKYASGSTGKTVEWDDGSGTPIPSIDMYVFQGGAAATGQGTVTVEGY